MAIMPDLPDAGDNHAPRGSQTKQVDRLTKTIIKAVGQLLKRLGFGCE